MARLLDRRADPVLNRMVLGMKRSERARHEAKQVEQELRKSGLHRMANVVLNIRRSQESAVATLKVLHRDNMELRKRLGLPSFLDAEKDKTDADKT